MVFTNIEDCQEYIRNLNWQDGMPGRLFQLGSMPFDDAVDISEKHNMELFIDMKAQPNTMCMCYVPGEHRIKAVMLAR